jgi:hypothetical protein
VQADEIIAVANREEGKHFTASQGTGGLDEDGTLIPTVSDYRTSHTNWCEEDCLNTSTVVRIRERVVSITGVPDANAEFPQMLRYHKDQYCECCSNHNSSPSPSPSPNSTTRTNTVSAAPTLTLALVLALTLPHGPILWVLLQP